MKYGVLFLLMSVCFTYLAIASRGWFLLLLWPAISFAIVGLAYLTLGESVFGKRVDGSLAPVAVLLLLPYLLCLWTVWHIARVISRESAYNDLVDGIVIGRRLLSRELPEGVVTVVDLTSEFPEPSAVRSVPHYVGAPMLDASALAPNELVKLAQRIATCEAPSSSIVPRDTVVPGWLLHLSS